MPPAPVKAQASSIATASRMTATISSRCVGLRSRSSPPLRLRLRDEDAAGARRVVVVVVTLRVVAGLLGVVVLAGVAVRARVDVLLGALVVVLVVRLVLVVANCSPHRSLCQSTKHWF